MRSRLVLVGMMVFAHVVFAGPEITRIQAVDVSQQAEVTRVRIHAAKPLEFTVYKLDRPSRVVLDLPRARLADALTGHDSAMVLTPSTWSVSTVGASQLDDGGTGVRLSITLARPGRYEVKPDGSVLIVIVTARGPAPLATRRRAPAPRPTVRGSPPRRQSVTPTAAGSRPRSPRAMRLPRSTARNAMRSPRVRRPIRCARPPPARSRLPSAKPSTRRPSSSARSTMPIKRLRSRRAAPPMPRSSLLVLLLRVCW